MKEWALLGLIAARLTESNQASERAQPLLFERVRGLQLEFDPGLGKADMESGDTVRRTCSNMPLLMGLRPVLP